MLFDEKQEKQWEHEDGKQKSPLKRADVEVDENLFHGNESPRKDNIKSSDNETPNIVMKSSVEKLKSLKDPLKVAQELRELTQTLKIRSELDPSFLSHENLYTFLHEFMGAQP